MSLSAYLVKTSKAILMTALRIDLYDCVQHIFLNAHFVMVFVINISLWLVIILKEFILESVK